MIFFKDIFMYTLYIYICKSAWQEAKQLKHVLEYRSPGDPGTQIGITLLVLQVRNWCSQRVYEWPKVTLPLGVCMWNQDLILGRTNPKW